MRLLCLQQNYVIRTTIPPLFIYQVPGTVPGTSSTRFNVASFPFFFIYLLFAYFSSSPPLFTGWPVMCDV